MRMGSCLHTNSIVRMSYRILILPLFMLVAVALVIGACDYVCRKRNEDDYEQTEDDAPLPHHGFVDLEERGAIAFRRAAGG